MIEQRILPGQIRDAIVDFLRSRLAEASIQEIQQAVNRRLGDAVPKSSVRSYLSLNTATLFDRTSVGTYRLKLSSPVEPLEVPARRLKANFEFGGARLYHADCFEWLAVRAPSSIEAVVTDPPYGLVEYSQKEQEKLRSGQGGVWRIPPSFDGHQRSPLPRFTTLRQDDLDALVVFFSRWARLLMPVLVPGAHVVVATNPLLSHLLASALAGAGLERRGEIIRLVMTMRGGDRPKNAHLEFPDVSVMPRSMYEPWVVFRKPLEGRVQDNLRKWKTGGFRRPEPDKPFGDVVPSSPTRSCEKKIAPHPSLKPQAFLRQIVRAVLPLGEGTVLDTFAGSGSTLAAAEAVGYKSIGIELDETYIATAKKAIGALSKLR
ncbi:MAG TPA: DNA methylase [Phycisphaerales bacterium]|nr:DNA methylase [Phycisphaerales bacterium]